MQVKLGNTCLPKIQGEETSFASLQTGVLGQRRQTAVGLTFSPLPKVNAMGLKERRARTLPVSHCTQRA